MTETPYQPDWFSKPGDTLAELMTRKNLSHRELAQKLQISFETINGVLTGKVVIDAALASRLAANIGGSESFWMKRQSAYDAALSRIAASIPSDIADTWLRKFSSQSLANTGLKRKGENKEEIIKSFLAFFGVTGPDDWEKRYASFPNDVVFRTTRTFESKQGALSVWLRKGELEAMKIPTADWNADHLRSKIESIRQLSKWKSPSNFVPQLRAICASGGVAVVFVRAPQGCRASGASRFILPNKAIIVLSFRHLSDDHFWFTFFHEIAHLLLHGREATFVDQDETVKGEREEEANAFAANALVPLHRHDDLISLSPNMQSIVRFAVSVGIAPGIVVGQMQHFGCIGPDKLNFLKRRYDWDEILSAFA